MEETRTSRLLHTFVIVTLNTIGGAIVFPLSFLAFTVSFQSAPNALVLSALIGCGFLLLSLLLAMNGRNLWLFIETALIWGAAFVLLETRPSGRDHVADLSLAPVYVVTLTITARRIIFDVFRPHTWDGGCLGLLLLAPLATYAGFLAFEWSQSGTFTTQIAQQTILLGVSIGACHGGIFLGVAQRNRDKASGLQRLVVTALQLVENPQFWRW